MKRSSHLKLTLMAVAMPAALSGCEPAQPTGTVLASVEDCAQTREVTLDQCRAAHATAAKEHQRIAPRFEDPSQCNEQFGNCTTTVEEGRTHWIPPMSGFLIGYALGGGFGGNRGVLGSAPLYREYRSGDYLKPNGERTSRTAGPVTGRRGNPAMPARAITLSRSGFGSSAAARSSFGGRGGGFGG